MKKKVVKIIAARARYGRVTSPAHESEHPSLAMDKAHKKKRTTFGHVFHRNPKRVLKERYMSTPTKDRPALIRKWLREIQVAQMMQKVL